MKKIILALAISLFGVSSAFSQWALDIKWDASECECSNGYFEIIYTIYDVANDYYVYTNKKISPIALTENSYEEDVPEVHNHCNEFSGEDAPNYIIHVTVNLMCNDGVITPIIVCSGTAQEQTNCYEFNLEDFPIGPIVMAPVP